MNALEILPMNVTCLALFNLETYRNVIFISGRWSWSPVAVLAGEEAEG